VHISPTTPSYSPRPHLQQCQNIYFSLIRPQFFFFTLRAEHGHAVGDCAAGSDLPSPQLICDVPVVIADY